MGIYHRIASTQYDVIWSMFENFIRYLNLYCWLPVNTFLFSINEQHDKWGMQNHKEYILIYCYQYSIGKEYIGRMSVSAIKIIIYNA
jgi:hypothetical protein